MAAEDAAVVVQLVHHDVAEVLEEADPLVVVGQDAGVEHVGVGDDDVAGLADGPAGGGRGVAVVGERLDVGADRFDQSVKLGLLVLGERLGREEVEGAGVRVFEDGVEDRQVVAEGLAAGGRRDDDDVAAGQRVLDRLGLVGVELVDAALRVRGLRRGSRPSGSGAYVGRPRGLVPERGDVAAVLAAT